MQDGLIAGDSADNRQHHKGMVQFLPMTLLANLNPKQYEAVTTDARQALVLAGPGSGKTRVLTQRIAYLVQENAIAPYQILAVTFTNKAAREMRNRVETLLNQELKDIWLGTFHSICARLLRRETDALPYRPNFVIFDEGDQETLVKRAIRELGIDEKTYRPPSVLANISNAKNELLLPHQVPNVSYRDEVVQRVYERYQGMLVENNALDFDDLLFVAVRLLRENPEICERYASRFQYVLVDEFQDTNLAQYELLKLLASHHHNIFVVGDEDQSIYRWRGADYRNVLRFEKDYPNCSKILLEQNYRSPQNVLDTARAVINRNPNRTPKHLFTERGGGDSITLYEAVDDSSEAVYVVDTIQQLVMSKRAQAADFAVMYRTNAQSRLMEEAFLRAGMPYRLVGAQRFYGRREVKDCIAYLRLVHNPDDEVSLGRIINVPTRGIGEKTVLSLLLAARQAHLSPGQVLLDLGQKGEASAFWSALSGRGAVLLADFGGMLANWIEMKETASLPALFDRILQDVVYQEYIQDNSDEAEDRWGNVQELRKLAYEYQERGITDFLENLALVSDQDTLPEELDAPTLLTLHASKGLEFSQVFIIGLDEGLLPHSRSREDPEQMMEERRLFYVGITRAKDRLYLVRAQRRSTYGSYEFSEASQFLEDIPAKLLKVQGSAGSSSSSSRGGFERSTRTQRNFGWNSLPAISKPEPVQRFQPAMRVKHASWGEGMVLDCRIVDGEEMVDVFFESVGFKRLMANIAPLEVL